MDYAVITLAYQQQRADLELPLSVPLFMLAPLMLEAMVWPNENQTAAHFVGRVQESGLIIRPNETLAQAGVVHGDVVELTAVQSIDFDTTLPPHPLPGEQSHKTYLQSVATGEIFPCRGKTTLIGRSPEYPINLSRLPHSNVVSRPHANIMRRDDGYWLSDHSANGTIVDGFALKRGERARLRNGCQIQFGQGGPLLVFHFGESMEPPG
jgi:hypothetical protein